MKLSKVVYDTPFAMYLEVSFKTEQYNYFLLLWQVKPWQECRNLFQLEEISRGTKLSWTQSKCSAVKELGLFADGAGLCK